MIERFEDERSRRLLIGLRSGSLGILIENLGLRSGSVGCWKVRRLEGCYVGRYGRLVGCR